MKSKRKRIKPVKLPAPAKVNLFLEVGSRRDDGYHNIYSVMQTISLSDDVIISPAESGISFSCDWSLTGHKCPNERNLGYKAAVLLKDYLNIDSGVKIRIKKKIPVSAGLGGGSSDAAAVIKGLLKLWQKSLSHRKLTELSLKLGSDVNFFFYGGCCIAKGRGEKITTIHPSWMKNTLWIVLVNPEFEVSTPDIYDSLENKAGKAPLGILRKARKLTTSTLPEIMFNRLEEVTFREHPRLRDLKKRLKYLGSIGTLMSGSGPTVYGVFDRYYTAKKALEELKTTYSDRWLTTTL